MSSPMQVSDAHALVLGQVPSRDLRLPRSDHGWIVQLHAPAAGDCPPVSPTFPGPRVDTHNPARLRVGDATRDQPCEPFPLLRLRRRTRSTVAHPNSRTPPVLRRSLETAQLNSDPFSLLIFGQSSLVVAAGTRPRSRSLSR